MSVGGGVAHIDPGSAIGWSVGCAATESLAIHGLPDGKTITRRRVAHVDSALASPAPTATEHEADRSDPNGHKFYRNRESFS